VNVDKLPGFFAGSCSVQDIGAQLAADYLDCQEGMRVLDACAAPGGKTCHLLEQYQLDLLALDHDAQRLRRVEQNLQRLQLHAKCQVADAADTKNGGMVRRSTAFWPMCRVQRLVWCAAILM